MPESLPDSSVCCACAARRTSASRLVLHRFGFSSSAAEIQSVDKKHCGFAVSCWDWRSLFAVGTRRLTSGHGSTARSTHSLQSCLQERCRLVFWGPASAWYTRATKAAKMPCLGTHDTEPVPQSRFGDVPVSGGRTRPYLRC